METRTLSKKEYAFDPTAKTVTFFNGWEQSNIITISNLVKNATNTTNTIIYAFGCEGIGGVMPIESHVLTLEFDTTSMDRFDNLVIVVEDLNDEKKVIEKNSHLLKEMLVELKLIKMHQEHATGERFKDTDIEE